MLWILKRMVEDSGAEVECRPLVPKVSGSNPMMNGFLLATSGLNFCHTNRASTGYKITLNFQAFGLIAFFRNFKFDYFKSMYGF